MTTPQEPALDPDPDDDTSLPDAPPVPQGPQETNPAADDSTAGED